MNIPITLDIRRTAALPTDYASGIVLPEEEVRLCFSSKYLLPELLISMKNGNIREQRKSRDGTVSIPSSLLFPGLLEIDVSLILRGQTVRRWSISPLLLKTIDGDFTAFDAVEQMQKDIEELKRKTEIIM